MTTDGWEQRLDDLGQAREAMRKTVMRCPACRTPYRTSAGYERHIDTHRGEDGKPLCNCLLPVELMGWKHQIACPVSWLP